MKAGRLKLEDVVAPGDLEKLNELYQREDIDSYAKMREAASDLENPHSLSIFWNSKRE